MKLRQIPSLATVLVLLLFSSIFTISCKDDDDSASGKKSDETTVITPDSLTPPTTYEIDSVQHYTPEQWADYIFGPDGANSDDTGMDPEEVAKRKEEFLKECKEYEDSMANVTGQNSFWLIFSKCNYHYYSPDENGNMIKLSAFCAWGSYWVPFHYSPLDQNKIMLVCPFTHTKESECATESNGGWEFTFLTHSYLYIMPDGEGFGDSKDRDQLYLNHNVQAKQIYNALFTGYEVYKNNFGGEMEDDWKLIVIGASQGAGDAMAVHRLLDTDEDGHGNKLAKTWRFDYSYVCCGPYSPRATVEYYYRNKNCQYPVTIPMVIKCMRNSNPTFAKDYPEERFYIDEYLKHKDEYDKIYKEKSMKTTEINEKMAKELGNGELPLSLDAIFSKEALNTESSLYKDFMKCLDDQDLTTGWTPTTKSYIIWSDNDVVVPQGNSDKIIQLFGDKCDVTTWSSSHPDCCKRFITTKKW